MVHNEVSLKEFANLIQAVGNHVTVVGAGEPGVGKSSMLKLIAERMPTHEPRYIDAALMDLGDLQMPRVDRYNHTRLTTRRYRLLPDGS